MCVYANKVESTIVHDTNTDYTLDDWLYAFINITPSHQSDHNIWVWHNVAIECDYQGRSFLGIDPVAIIARNTPVIPIPTTLNAMALLFAQTNHQQNNLIV